jgi:CspA family cold shock protein
MGKSGKASRSEVAEKRYSGTVKWFSDEKGYGFVIPDDKALSQQIGGKGDLFVHQSEIQMQGRRVLIEDQRVEFSLGSGQKGLFASSVVPLD